MSAQFGTANKEPIDDPELDRRAAEAGADYEVNLESLSQTQLAWRKFKRHRLALIGLGDPAVHDRGGHRRADPHAVRVRRDPASRHDRLPGPRAVPAHPFGETGGLQRDVMMLVVNGARTSLLIGFSSMLIGVFIGTIVGSIAGFAGGFPDNFLMRVVDVMLSLPVLFVILIFSRFFGSGNVDRHRRHLRAVQLDGRQPPRPQPVPVDPRA